MDHSVLAIKDEIREKYSLLQRHSNVLRDVEINCKISFIVHLIYVTLFQT